MQINLLTETEEILAQHKLTFNSIKFIANAEGTIEVAAFTIAAQNYTYNNQYELDEVNVDPTLVIVGGTWWLSRIVYNNIEQWFFHKKPPKPTLKSVDFSINSKRNVNKKVVF